MSEKTKDILEWIFCIVIAVVLALFVRYFIGTPTIVKQPSMFPTLKENQRLILSRVGRTMKKLPERGDIITFEAPSEIYTTEENYNSSYPVATYNNNHSGVGKFVYNFLFHQCLIYFAVGHLPLSFQ